MRSYVARRTWSPGLHPLHRTDTRTFGQQAADFIATHIGSWRFIIGQSVILVCWIIINVFAIIRRWDPYPFILLNLMLSFQAAYTGPIVMMSQNRASDKDRHMAEIDYVTNKNTFTLLTLMYEHITGQQCPSELLEDIARQLESQGGTQPTGSPD